VKSTHGTHSCLAHAAACCFLACELQVVIKTRILGIKFADLTWKFVLCCADLQPVDVTLEAVEAVLFQVCDGMKGVIKPGKTLVRETIRCTPLTDSACAASAHVFGPESRQLCGSRHTGP
jgi:hypothetical protein